MSGSFLHRVFSDRGAVYDGLRQYFVKAADLEYLRKSVASDNRWLLCYGPRGSGKSSLLLQILPGLGFNSVHTDCSTVWSLKNSKDEAAAVGALAGDLLRCAGKAERAEAESRVQTVDTLLEMMCTYYEGKVVWFLEGLDCIEDLSVVKVLVNGLVTAHRNGRHLHSLVLSGGSRLKDIVTTALSPDDNLCLLRPMDNLTQESIETMLEEFKEEHGYLVEDLDKIASSIFDLTFGHKQSVGMLCYFLYDLCRTYHVVINSEVWDRYVGAGAWTCFVSRRIGGNYRNYSEEIQVLLTECLLRGSVLTDTSSSMLQKLIDDGLLRQVSTEEDGLKVRACASSALMLSIMLRTFVTEGPSATVDCWTRTALDVATIAAAILFMTPPVLECKSQYELECQFLLALKHLDCQSCIAEAVAEGPTSYRLGIVLKVRSVELCPLQGFVLHLGSDDALAEHLQRANEHAELHDFQMNYINLSANDEAAAKLTKLAMESEAPKWKHVRCWCASYASGRWTIERLDMKAGWITMQKDACHLPKCKFVGRYMDMFYTPEFLSEKSTRLKREREAEAEAERLAKQRKQEVLKVESEEPPLLPPLKEEFTGRATLVLDLDFTLVHTVADKDAPWSTMNTAEFSKHVFKRPGVDEFLRKMAQLYEVVIYSAGHQDYVDRVLEILDPSKEIFAHRLYWQHTMEIIWTGSTIKTLDKLGRDMKRVVMVDDDRHVFRDTPLNGIWLKHYVNDGHHDDPNQLEEITAYLTRIANVSDVREGMSRDERSEWNEKQALCSPGCTFENLQNLCG